MNQLRTPDAILVVDDDAAIRETLADFLELEGYPVVGASNGLEALEKVERDRPRLILLDMRMPVLDGWAFARTLQERGIVVPVIVMTAAQDARRWADEIAADGFVAKPFDLDHLLDQIQQIYGAA